MQHAGAKRLRSSKMSNKRKKVEEEGQKARRACVIAPFGGVSPSLTVVVILICANTYTDFAMTF